VHRALATIWESGARPVVVLTKADLSPAPEREVRASPPSRTGSSGASSWPPVRSARATPGAVTPPRGTCSRCRAAGR
jgi:hypothetical protein